MLVKKKGFYVFIFFQPTVIGLLLRIKKYTRCYVFFIISIRRVILNDIFNFKTFSYEIVFNASECCFIIVLILTRTTVRRSSSIILYFIMLLSISTTKHYYNYYKYINRIESNRLHSLVAH